MQYSHLGHIISLPFLSRKFDGEKTEHETLVVGSNDIVIGDSLKDVRIIVYYDATRGEHRQSGVMEVNIPYTDYVEEFVPWEYYFDDDNLVGLSVIAVLDGTNVVLRITVDGSSADEVTFDYNLQVITGMKETLYENLSEQIAFKSSSFDFENSLWLDDSGNDNHVEVLSKKYKGNAGWGYVRDNWIDSYGFTSYHEVLPTSGEGMILLSFGATGGSNDYMRLQVLATGELRIFNRSVNTTSDSVAQLSYTTPTKVLCHWISKDDIKIYINDETTPVLFAENKNWAWRGTWNKIGIQHTQNGGANIFTGGGYEIKTKIKAGIQGWGDMVTGLLVLWFNTFGNPESGTSTGLSNYDYSGNDRHLTVIAPTALPTTGIYLRGTSPYLEFGYDVYRKEGSPDFYVPNNGTKRTVNTALYPFRAADWQYYASVQGETSKLNGADVKIAFPYNEMTVASDAILEDALFTETVPNQLIADDIWEDHKEKHVLFLERSTVEYLTSIGTTKDETIRSVKTLLLFKQAQISYSTILNFLGYSATPKVISSSSLVYRMISGNDSFKLSASEIGAIKLAGLYYLFFAGETGNTPLKTRFADVEKINGRNIFCNGTDTLWIYPKPLLPTDLRNALSTHLGLNNIENLVTTMNDGQTYYNLDYEKLTPVAGVINFNPTESEDTKYDIFDRRNVVGSAKEIWHADLLAESDYWSWNLSTGVKKINQPTTSKYIQIAGKLFVRQDWSKENKLSIPYLISFTTPLSGSAKTAMFNFIDFPETFNEPAIVGDGVTDDATAINAALVSNDAVLLYEKSAVILSSVRLTSDTELILADSEIKLGDDINKNVITNADWDENENCKITGYGTSVINGNGAEQDREANPDTVALHHYDYIGMMFINVENISIKGIIVTDFALWGVNTQKCSNILIEHIIMNQLGSYANQDGIDVGFGSQYGVIRYITGKTNDDFIPSLNYNLEYINPKGTRTTKYIYYRNIYHGYIVTGSTGNQTIRIYAHLDSDIQDVEYQNIYHSQGDSGSLIYFSKSSVRDASLDSFNFIFNNIRGKSTRNFRVQQGSIYSDIQIDDLCLDTDISVSDVHILIEGDSTVITNCEINSKLYFEPTALITINNNPTLTNFEHNEEIFY